MQLSILTTASDTPAQATAALQPSLIAEAWSADTETVCHQAQVHGLELVSLSCRSAVELGLSVLRWCTHIPALRLWGWLRGGETNDCTRVLPVVYLLSFEHLQFLATNFDDLKTQQRLVLSDLQERLCHLERQIQRIGHHLDASRIEATIELQQSEQQGGASFDQLPAENDIQAPEGHELERVTPTKEQAFNASTPAVLSRALLAWIST